MEQRFRARASGGAAGRERPGSDGRTADRRRVSRSDSGDRRGEADQILDRLRDAVGRDTVARYFGRSAQVQIDGDQIRVRAASRFAVEMIERRFGSALRDATGSKSLRFEVAPPPQPERAPGKDAAGRGPERPGSPGASVRAPRPSGASRSGDPAQTLENFVVGACNRFAVAAVARLAEESAEPAGPVFVHGPCGVGKSHLLNAAANRFRATRPGSRVRVVTAEAFTNEYIGAIRSNTIESFHRAYRRVDLLCIDDIHFLATKSGTQQELLHTFDHLCGSGGRLVLASDSHPGTVRQFSEALVSRFVSGSLVKVDTPDPETRRRLLVHFARRSGMCLSREAMGVVEASVVAGSATRGVSVRDLSGAITRLRAYRLAVGAPEAAEITASDVVAAIRAQGGVVPGDGSLPHPVGELRTRRPVSMSAVIDRVCESLEVTRDELAGSGRHPRVVLARAGVTWLARRLTRHSYPEIAHAIGRRNHSTVITAHKRIQRQIDAGDLVGVGLAIDGEPVSVMLDRIAATLRDSA